MPRTHIIQSWVGAAEYDEGDTYSGEQIGNRNQKSIGVLIERSGDQWKAGNVSQDIPTFVHGRANVSAFAEPVAKPKKAPAKTKSVLSSILLADRNYERLCNLSQQLDDELDSGRLTDLQTYCAARKNLDARLTKAWERVCKERPELLEPEQYPNQGLGFTLDIEHPKASTIDYSILPNDSVFTELQDGNIFKQCACVVLTACKWFAKFTTTTKQLIREGLV